MRWKRRRMFCVYRKRRDRASPVSNNTVLIVFIFLQTGQALSLQLNVLTIKKQLHVKWELL